MKLDILNKWLMLAANIGVIAGIVFLGVEIQQNNESLASQARLSLHEMRSNDANRVFFNNSDFIEIYDKVFSGEELDDTELYILRRYYRQILLNWQFSYFEYKGGFVSLENLALGAWKPTMDYYPFMLDSWESSKNNAFNPDFVEFMETNIITPDN